MTPVRAALAALCAAALVLAGCTAARPGTGVTTSPSAGHCPALGSWHGTPEARGTGTVSLHGLVMAPHVPVRTGDQVKIVWRVTGTGPARFWATDAGRRIRLAWGPDLHSGSNYHRPGQEWGTGYRFPRPGCWQLHARRGAGQAVAPLLVTAR